MRTMSDVSGEHEEELREQGWIKRSALDEPRLGEIVDLYKSLGFEVRLEPAHPGDLGADCSMCYSESCHKFTMIYTRKISGDSIKTS